MNLILNKPLVIFDLETTGISTSKDRIVEIFMIKILPNGERIDYYSRFNPEMPISPQATAVHGISNEDVKDEPTFKEKSTEIFQFIYQCDFAGFNSNKFDFPMLVEELYRSEIDFDISKCKFIDAQRIFHIMEPRNLAAAYKFYCNESLENAHSAKADTEATWNIIQAQLGKYENLENNIDYLHKFSGQSNLVDLAGRLIYNEKQQVIFNFGKHKGKTFDTVMKEDPSYYEWMMKGEFALQTKKVITQLRLNALSNK